MRQILSMSQKRLINLMERKPRPAALDNRDWLSGGASVVDEENSQMSRSSELEDEMEWMMYNLLSALIAMADGGKDIHASRC